MRERLEILAKARTRACSPRALATAFSSRALSRIAARACALSLATIFAMPAGAIDGTATVTGGEVEFYGATETNWLNGTELLLKFTGEGSFILPGQTKARILAVGGGGGGGGAYSGSAGFAGLYGGGGGGGAGGVVEMANVFSASTYAIVVGSGGAGGAFLNRHGASYNYAGSSGGATTLSTNGIALITAVGGGGGGGECAGLSGGSGGGGSQYRTSSTVGTSKEGGAPTPGQGNTGGTGDAGMYGGGGGGAGGAGAAASTLNPVGGDGRASDITGESVYYAGGGGGGFSDKSFTGLHDPIAGGKGGGGSGGYGKIVSATAGVDGLGGGGGGANADTTSGGGAAGGSGVVYVRIIVIATGEIVKPINQLVDFDGLEHVLVPANPAYTITDLTEGSATYGEEVEQIAGSLSGTYKAKVKLVDGFKWSDDTTDEVTVTLTISKATPVISNLKMRDWIEGTPLEATPNPGCDVSIAVTPAYFYGESSTGPWVYEKPAVAGDYYLRAYIEGTESYNEAEAIASFKILKGPGDIYRDYVDIAIGGVSPAKTDFVYALKLSEGNPKGFLYSRAGKTGEDLAVTDANGNLLDYRVFVWDVAGESTLWIKLPTLPTTGLKVRLFWYLREGKTAPEHTGEILDLSDGQPGCTFDLVVRDGKRVNYWLTEPSLTKTKWDELFDTPGAVESIGTIKEGTSSLLYVTNLNTGAVYDGIENKGGSFSAIFGPHDPAGDYEPMEFPVDYFVIGHPSYSDLSGDYWGEEDALTRNGRVLLVNDDSAPGGYSVKGQSYWQTDGEKYSTYWVHSGSSYSGESGIFPYLQAFVDHVLYAVDLAGNVAPVWTLEDVFIGNTYATGPSARSTGCYLPNSSTAKAISSETASPGLAEQGNMVMRNKLGAVILSPIYTNGVGTIYFDVVNADTRNVAAGIFKIKVEVSLDAGTNYTEYAMLPFKRDNAPAFVPDQTDTTELKLEITNGGTADNFYRVAVPVNSSANVRFRIVRTSMNSSAIPDSYFILVDNILVSYPKSTASLEPYGDYDDKRTGKQVVGWGGAMSVPFPAVGDNSVYARAKAIVDTNVNAHVAVDMPISWAQMWYHWRYLDQQTNDWQAINLRPTAGFVSLQPLDVPAREGDVEFWYEYIVQVPAYKYHDYSGLDLDFKGSDGMALYTEEVTESKNTQADVTGYKKLPSGGTDWFFRLRRGKSDFESFTIYAKESEGGEVREYPMSLSGNHMWRGLCPTREEIEGGLLVRIAGRNRQTPGNEDYDRGMVRYSLAKSTSVLPATDILSERPDDDSWEWFAVPCDAKSGNVLIQLQDDTLAYTVVHADYQDFNGWNDANKEDKANGIFVGTWKDGESTPSAYTTPDAVTYSSDFGTWNETIATNAYWNEFFLATKAELDAGKWPLYDPFESVLSPNTAFTVGPGQWVNGYYRDNNTGMALQMEGRGKGYIQFVNAAESPRGLESVTFKARVAQAIDFGDFCYLMGDPTSMANYTFATAASFDVNSRKDFAGNASLSLVALYTPGIGCYELRVEQENASINAAGVVSPGTTFRLSLYRWAYDEETEEIVATRLGTETHSNGANMFATASESGNYARLFISVDTSVANETRVVGGVARTSVARANFFSSASYREVMIRDTADNRHTTGSYGFLSANCPAHFLQPSYSTTPVTYQAPTKTGFQYGTWSLAPLASRVECRADIAAGRWAIKKARMVAVNTGDPNTYGINAVEPEATIDVYTADSGTTDWSPLETNIVVKGFGAANSAGTTTTIPLYSLDEVSVKICAGGTAKTARKDVTIDDISFNQWRGESYDEKGQYGVFDRTLYGSPTNIVFTQGWVSTNGVDSAKSCLLSAKRSYSNVATSIRSPRMVDENTDKGLGLGSVGFDYENAQSNAVVLVQIATNVALSGFADLAKSTSPAEWTTVTNIDFSAMTAAERKSGSVRIYIGLHGARGAMRIALDPKVVKAVEKVRDPTAFGEVTITGVSFRDEPELDKYSWWGWNLRTTDDPAMRSLADNAAEGKDVGLSFGLNNSVTEDVRKDEPAEQFAKKFPFVQTPTFATNLVNEVSFMARLYNTNDAAARVTLYGAKSGDLSIEALWVKIASWDVTNATYEVYSKKFAPGNPYMAFRLAVTGVAGVTEPMPDDDPPKQACRVLIDEVLVMEGISAAVGFRNVGAFRFGLDETTASENVPSPGQQPLVGEQWGVQCEVYASQLVDEIDLSSASVRLWWYDSDAPWGFDNWKDLPEANSAWLMEASDTNLVFRSCLFGASGAVMKAQSRPCTVQYMLEVIYRANGAPQTNFLSGADWQTPSWYAPLDYNADNGGAFSAYTILDTVAPGWAWINEMNIFGKYEGWNYDNTDKLLQFLEIAAPSEADLSEWSVQFVEASVLDGKIYTNEVARFGAGGLPGKKKGMKGMDPESKCVFHVIASPLAKGSLDAEDGRFDAAWVLPNYYSGSAFSSSGELNASYPQSVQLMRPSGIVEHEIVLIGTNDYPGVEYQPANHVEYLNKRERGGRWFYAGSDSEGVPTEGGWSRSVGVFKEHGDSDDDWNNANLMSPGRINEGQVISEQPPQPHGTALVIYSFIDGGHIAQTFGEQVGTRENVTLVYRKESDEPTNITYNVDRWYEIGPVTVNGGAVTPVATGNEREWTLAVGAHAENDIVVMASAQVDQTLAAKYGLGPDNRYTGAIIDWLTRGTDAYGNDWHNPTTEVLGLADQVDESDNVVTNLTLNEMYWLDIDPTWSDHDIRLKGHYSILPHDRVVPATAERPCHTNVAMTLFMQISNRVDGSAWAPYILQGVELAGNSWTYMDVTSDWRWTNETFKVTGRLLNGKTDPDNERNWIPLRRFLFTKNSFDSNFESMIEIVDPYSTASPGWNAGWADWVREHGPTTIGWGWDISDRSWPESPDELKPDSTLP